MAEIKDNQAQLRYEIEEGGYTVYADYGLKDGVLSIKYVYAPEELRGTGAAGRLMEGIVQAAKAKNLKIFPICGYATAWLRKHKEYHGLMA